MVEKAERLRERLKKEFCIETDEQLLKELDSLDLDLGIFVTPYEGGQRNAS